MSLEPDSMDFIKCPIHKRTIVFCVGCLEGIREEAYTKGWNEALKKTMSALISEGRQQVSTAVGIKGLDK